MIGELSQLGKSCNGSLRANSCSVFESGFRNESPRAKLRSCSGFFIGGVLVKESYGEDVDGDEAVLELEAPLDNPGTTVGT